MDCSLPGSFIHGIFQAKILEWVAISFSRRSSQPRDWTWVSHIVGRCFTVWAIRGVWRNHETNKRNKKKNSCYNACLTYHHHHHIDTWVVHTSCAHAIAKSLPKSFKAEACVIVSKNLWELWSISVDGNRFRLHCANGHYYLLCGQVRQTGSPNRPVFSKLETLPCLYFLLEEDIF